MATIIPTQIYPPTGSIQHTSDVIVTTWAAVTPSDTCIAVEVPGYTDQTVQVTGTFATSTAALVGSNDGTNFIALNNTKSTTAAVSFTAVGMMGILENPLWVKPTMTTGSDSITFILVSRR